MSKGKDLMRTPLMQFKCRLKPLMQTKKKKKIIIKTIKSMR